MSPFPMLSPPTALLLGAGFATSLALSVLLVLTARAHGRFTMDLPGAVQKFHRDPTPRIGGLSLYAGVLAAWILDPATGLDGILLTVLIAGLPALLFGLMEDVTKRVGPGTRLLATMASGVLAWLVGDVALTHLEVPAIDWLLAMPPIAVLFTAFAVAGVANAVNIIDGFHGLAGGTVVVASLALAAIAYAAGDKSLALGCIVLAIAMAGFLCVNFPLGKLFLGDGGAYFAGFALAWLAVLLPMRNPSVSPWSSLLVCSYPITEVVYSMLRRRVSRHDLARPDSEHMHSLLATEFVQSHWAGLAPWSKSAVVSAIMWLHPLATALLAVAFYRHTATLAALVAGYVAAYHLLYRHLARSMREAVMPGAEYSQSRRSEWIK